jgi:uncharacterized damage-inducible protein DinB
MTDPRYPIGPFTPPTAYTPELRAGFFADLEEGPRLLREAVSGLSREQLLTPYREGGWTVAQVVHHMPDSHLNAYSRMKMAVTEDGPAIKSYEEGLWAELADANDPGTIGVSLGLLGALHARWVAFLRSLRETDFARTYTHPEQGPVPLDRGVALYAWHSRHHVAHVTALAVRMGWSRS